MVAKQSKVNTQGSRATKRTTMQANTRPSKRAKTSIVAPTAKCPKNQSLVGALRMLVEAISQAQSNQPKLRFRASQLEKVVDSLAELDCVVASGKALSSGKNKIKGLGKVTAEYIDEFLKDGTISAIDKYRKLQDENGASSNDNTSSGSIIYINRAPILALWVSVVSERQGYTREEALTHAKWIQVILARSKGKSLGKFIGASKGTKGKDSSNDSPKEHVFGKMQVPVKSSTTGQRLAVMGGGSIDPSDVERYLHRSFGCDLERVLNSLRELASSMDPMYLRDSAYKLYEELRPEWQGWGKPGKFDLNKVHQLCRK